MWFGLELPCVPVRIDTEVGFAFEPNKCRDAVGKETAKWSYNKVRELIAVKMLRSSLLNTTVVAF